MSIGDGPSEKASFKERTDRLVAQADGFRAARLSGRKSLVRRVIERLRPHRQEPSGNTQINYGTSDDPGR
jgi:hypothetical protein